ncbi:MAG: hypothetical protein NTW86_07190 [Candidatus Sumerlaeota bacterium]|nr:hypothetical protein [Candidatus Sumerlaeota bacterium]
MRQMVCVMAGALLLCLPLTGRAAESPKTLKVFILSGQSNAGGAGNGDELPEAMKQTDPEVLQYVKQGKKVAPLAPYPRVEEKFGIKSQAFGPELAFGKEIKKAWPQETILIVKQSEGACSIIAWDKNWQREGWKEDLKAADNENKKPQYDNLMSFIHEGVALAKEQTGIGQVEYCGMLWVQSERDNGTTYTAHMYEANLKGLIANVRQDLGVPNLPFLFADANGAGSREPGSLTGLISEGMRRVEKDVPITRLIPISDLPKNGGVHYNTQGQLILGKRFADALLEMRRK